MVILFCDPHFGWMKITHIFFIWKHTFANVDIWSSILFSITVIQPGNKTDEKDYSGEKVKPSPGSFLISTFTLSMCFFLQNSDLMGITAE